MRPRRRSGRECRIEIKKRLVKLGPEEEWEGTAAAAVVVEDDDFLTRARAETTPAEKTKEPTPRSMRDVPQVSTLAKRRGKMRKSTARMERHVAIIMLPR